MCAYAFARWGWAGTGLIRRVPPVVSATDALPRQPFVDDNADMATLLQLSVAAATRDQFDELDARVGQAMSEAGGPPAGLMSHVVHPEGAGFTVAQVWRTEAEGRTYLDETLRPLLTALNLAAGETTADPVWSFARP